MWQAHLIYKQKLFFFSEHISLALSPEILFIIRNCCFEKTTLLPIYNIEIMTP